MAIKCRLANGPTLHWNGHKVNVMSDDDDISNEWKLERMKNEWIKRNMHLAFRIEFLRSSIGMPNSR